MKDERIHFLNLQGRVTLRMRQLGAKFVSILGPARGTVGLTFLLTLVIQLRIDLVDDPGRIYVVKLKTGRQCAARVFPGA